MAYGAKNSLLCPECRRLISADEPVCPYCGLSKPGSPLKKLLALAFSEGSVDPVRIILIANVVFFILSLLLNPYRMGFSGNPLNFLSPSNDSVFLLGATGTIPIGSYGRWWTLLSASFLHGGILHIFFNMMALHQLGPFVVQEFGSSRFTAIYILAGVGGFLLSYLAGIPFTLGASASICGLIGAVIYYGKSRGGSYGAAIYKQAMGWIVGLVIFGLLMPAINNWAHGGGLAAGIILGFLLGYNDKHQEGVYHRFLAFACVLATAAALIWAAGQAAILILFK
ncbi:MAG: rhomboid family intramembrane serine protease [Deltaproteobacteria bacterium]|nr:rhomboid family intramembrane serine protease [Deltaproteobacteria bacterium]